MAYRQFQFDGANWATPDPKDSRYIECLIECLRCRSASADFNSGLFDSYKFHAPISENNGIMAKYIMAKYDEILRNIISSYYDTRGYVRAWNNTSYPVDPDSIPCNTYQWNGIWSQFAFDQNNPETRILLWNALSAPRTHYQDGSIAQNYFEFSTSTDAPPRWSVASISEAAGFTSDEWLYAPPIHSITNEYISGWIANRYKILNLLRYTQWQTTTFTVRISASNDTYKYRRGTINDMQFALVHYYPGDGYCPILYPRWADGDFFYADVSQIAGTSWWVSAPPLVTACDGTTYSPVERESSECAEWSEWSAWYCNFQNYETWEWSSDCGDTNIFPIPDPPNNVTSPLGTWYYTPYSYYGDGESYQFYNETSSGSMDRYRTCLSYVPIPATSTPWLDAVNVLCQGNGWGQGARVMYNKALTYVDWGAWDCCRTAREKNVTQGGDALAGEVTADWLIQTTVNNSALVLTVPCKYTGNLSITDESQTCGWATVNIISGTPFNLVLGYSDKPPEIVLNPATFPDIPTGGVEWIDTHEQMGDNTYWLHGTASCGYDIGFGLLFFLDLSQIPDKKVEVECFNDSF